MKRTTLLIASAIPSGSALATLLPKYVDPILGNATIVPLTWSAEINKSTLTLSGDVQGIYSQLKSLVPNFTLPDSHTNSTYQRRGTQTSYLPYSGLKTNCFTDTTDHSEDHCIFRCQLQQAAKYLRAHTKSQCGVGKGPKKCARVSCDNNIAVFLCNDDPNNALSVPCSDVANAIDDIVDTCKNTVYRASAPARDLIWPSQLFMKGNWNVYVPAPTQDGEFYDYLCKPNEVHFQPIREVDCLAPGWTIGGA